MRPRDERIETGPRATDVRHLRIRSSRLVTNIFAGEYRSAFRGRGIEFEEVREYQPGDDIRAIDWNVTARCGRPFVKQFMEEREITVMILLDLSPSLDGASPQRAKSDVAVEICALLTFAAVRSNDRVGLVTFTDRVERHVPPVKGPRHAERVLAELRRAPEGCGTDLAGVLTYLERIQRRSCVLVIVSDFLAADFRLPLIAAAKRHDVIAVSLIDTVDRDLPSVGLLDIRDPETGKRRLLDAGHAKVRAAYRDQALAAQAQRRQVFAEAGVDGLEIAVDSSPIQALARFFLGRSRRRGARR
jgi:uncharacterized protein (DUF58 family)